ncbi:6-carboxytetrahydropterin synthase QueD [Pseudothermotoga thermarum]|uniref:6-carboxy-5,6,7,8-tetrahydropterin synthase n=1 Tax=Pseudothermotoga thermarum DSM 5069 TaxID=688269 RepID=F7YU56_9THEM|nr:6-carboxytetrahydropterin synthase QueD [Pseudothermotoga thermarum]AEH50152.1 6-pyruvoyl tetrahydropterin synthase and hypothetical protein [Pseudothermotoga thermarum DSM 5069]
MYLISRDFKFDAAHKLEKYHGKCEALHGHTYKLRVTLIGIPNEEGMVVDFVQLKTIVQEKVLKVLDHSYLNEIIPQPTAENIAKWIWQMLEESLTFSNCKLYEVIVWETEDCFVTYRGG